MKTQEQELADAAKNHRQPICVYCEKPLDVVTQTQYDYLEWTWNEQEKKFIKSEDNGGDADKPMHALCTTPDWDFVDSGEVSRILGLEY